MTGPVYGDPLPPDEPPPVFTAGWVERDDGTGMFAMRVPGLPDAATVPGLPGLLTMPRTSQESCAVQHAEAVRAEGAAEALAEDRRVNAETLARLSGHTATSVSEVFENVKRDDRIAARWRARHANDQPQGIPSEAEITAQRLHESRLHGSQPGRAARLARIRAIVRPIEEQARERVYAQRSGSWAHFGERDR